MPETIIVIVNGLPATGKTTLARKIGQELHLPVFVKDDLKELIADSIGANNPSFKGLGNASHSILFYITDQCLTNNTSLIIEGNFKDTEHTKKFVHHLKESGKKVFEILCFTEDALRFERYKNRERHPVHPTLSDPEYEKNFKEAESFSLDVGTSIKVDTSDFSSIPYQNIINTINNSI